EGGLTSGIHWHMNIANEVTYVAMDRQRLVIPWVKSRSKDGTERIYKSTDGTPTEEEMALATTRRMDCVDCHNRPTHIYHPPQRSINQIMDLGWIDRELPYVKSLAVQVLEQPYTTRQVALDSIRLAVDSYYRTNYPALAVRQADKIEKAIVELQKVYRRNYFPEMKHDWRQYPDHIGHMFAPGCFRCHDGKHVSDDGKVLSKDCNACHTIIAQQYENEKLKMSLEGLVYEHPVDIGTAWNEMNCSDCHQAQ
ncbi:MAG: cytochrome c3 family protein, partial [Bacteroidota bacterium]